MFRVGIVMLSPKNRRAQGAVGYLLLIAAVLLVAWFIIWKMLLVSNSTAKKFINRSESQLNLSVSRTGG